MGGKNQVVDFLQTWGQLPNKAHKRIEKTLCTIVDSQSHQYGYVVDLFMAYCNSKRKGLHITAIQQLGTHRSAGMKTNEQCQCVYKEKDAYLGCCKGLNRIEQVGQDHTLIHGTPFKTGEGRYMHQH